MILFRNKKSSIRKKMLSFAITGALALGLAIGMTACDDSVTYTFEVNGGVAMDVITLGKGEEITLPTPTREGFAFEGWYTNAEFTGEAVTKAVADEDIVYYAKWKQLPAITLELDGGAMSSATLYLKAGENVYSFMQNYTPTKNGLVFGGWFNGKTALSESLKMPEGGLTLKAKYKAQYTAEIYLEKVDGSGYERVEDIVDYAYVNEAFTSKPTMTGFEEVETADSKTSMDAISANTSENVFKHYFKRSEFSVYFNYNYPTAENSPSEVVDVVYGEEVTVLNDCEYEGYCLIGWATDAISNKVVYNAYYVDQWLYRADGEAMRTPDTFLPEGNTVLYAVWAKGYVDLFGGEDKIYYLGEEGVAYLSRGGVFFKGEYGEGFQEVYFGDMIGKLYENNTFSYFNDGKTYTLRVGQGLDESTKIVLIDNTVTFTKDGDQSKGTFVRGEEKDCIVITYNSGSLAGQVMTIKTRVATIKNEEGKESKQAVFNIRNEEEAALSTGDTGEGLFRVLVNDGSVGAYYPLISLDGFGVATLTSPTSVSTYYYTLNDAMLVLSSTEGGSSALKAKITEWNGLTVYVLYEEQYDRSFTLPSGEILTLDGGCQATYTVDDKTQEGLFGVSESQFGALVTVWADTQYKFLIKTQKEDRPVVGGDAGETETVTTYTVERKPVGYAEYRYVEAGSVYWAPLMVFDETTEGKATLYAQHKETGAYVKVSVGGYQLVDDYYVYTAEEKFDADELNETPFDLLSVKSVVFQVDKNATEYSLMYWKSYTTDEDVITNYVKEYISANGDTLKFVGGFAFLREKDGTPFMGAYATKDGLTTLINNEEYRYVELGEDNSFVLLQYAPYTANLLTENDAVNKMEYVEFDGKGNAVYVKVLKAATQDTPAETESIAGVVTQEGETLSGEKIYLFTANDASLSFKYINVPDTTYVARWHETCNGAYQSESGKITLDGFGYKATFVESATGTSHEGLYTITAENEITFYAEEEERIFYFDVKANKTFTQRGEEFGSYLFVDNQNVEAYIDFNGYGKASIYTMQENGEEYVKNYVDAEATYTQDGDVFSIVYKDGNAMVTVEAKIGALVVNGTKHNAMLVVCRDAVRVYVNEDDWSILILDEIGNAVKYNEEGVKEEGTYVLVTENFLYYVNNDLTDACVYVYDVEAGTATPVKFDRRSYYTSELERLLFSEYGYAYFGNTRYYYYENEKGEVMLYRQAEEGETPNAYGFVEDTTFGTFDGDSKQYAGKTYYKSSGFGINLDRAEATKNLYPVQISNSNPTKYALQTLTFNPGADEEYIVMGSVTLNGEAYDCYVIRERNEEGKLELYISLSYYRFYIDVTYNGTENSYEVTRLEYVRSLYSYNYLYVYYLNAIFFGTELENKYGMVHICADYNEQGEIINQYVVGEFLENSNLYDEDGNIISFKEAKYSYNRGMYGAEFKAEDGYTYTLYFGLQYQSAMGRYGYTVAALARHQTLTTEDGYKVTVQTIVYSDLDTVSAGSIYTVTLEKNGVVFQPEAIFAVDNTIYYVVREREESKEDGKLGKVTSTKYYHIRLTEEEKDESIEGETDTSVSFFKSATVMEETVNTHYMENGVVYVDISETRGVTYIVMADGSYVVNESSYNEETKTYTVKTTSGVTFTVAMLEDGYVDVTKI